MTYTVTLVGFSGASRDVVHAAETRFRTALDKALGDRVLAALKAFEDAAKADADARTLGQMASSAEWRKAYELAQAAGFRTLGDPGKAYFDVRAA
jgi:hypothetical protein